MRNLYRIFLILVLLLIFMAAFLFVTANTQPVTLAVPVADWQYQVTLGALVVVLLAPSSVSPFAAVPLLLSEEVPG